MIEEMPLCVAVQFEVACSFVRHENGSGGSFPVDIGNRPPQSMRTVPDHRQSHQNIILEGALPLLETVGAMKLLTWVDLETAATTERAR